MKRSFSFSFLPASSRFFVSENKQQIECQAVLDAKSATYCLYQGQRVAFPICFPPCGGLWYNCDVKIYLGCYTDKEHPDGLETLELDEATGEMRLVAAYPVSGAIYQALSPCGKYLYSCTSRGLESFRIGEDGSLSAVDSIDIGRCVCHVAAMPDGKRVLYADYLGGFAGSVAVSGGRFSDAVRHVHSGSGPNLPRQDSAHCHQAVPLPGGNGYCVVDLGLDRLVEYPYGRVFDTVPAGAGPRHLLFHPEGRLAFLVSELGGRVTSLKWSDAGGFSTIAGLSATACETPNLAAAIRFTPGMDGVAVSNRGEDTIAVFGFDASSGSLWFKARTRLGASGPRDFIFVGSGIALAACEKSGEVLSLKFDPASGTFERLSSLGALHRPVALLAAP